MPTATPRGSAYLPLSFFYWPDRHYVSVVQADANRKFTFTYDDRIDLLARGVQYDWCTFFPKELSDRPCRHAGPAILGAHRL